MKGKLAIIKGNIVTGFIILCAILILLAGCGAGNTKADVVARVNGEDITKDDLYELMVKQSGEQALDALITQKMIELEAESENMVVSDEDIEKELEKYYEYYDGKEGFIQTIEASGYTLEEVKKDVVITIKTKMLLKPRITISAEEMKTYFDENTESFSQAKEVKASHILVETKETADEIKDKLAKGEDFGELVKEYSIDTTTKEIGGDLGFFASGKMVKEFEEAAFVLKVGEISDPVKSEYGYHIIKVEEIKEAKEANYEENKEEINDILFEQKIQGEYEPWLEELNKKYEIENLLGKK